MKNRMTKRIAVIITAVAVGIAGVPCVYAATYLKGDVDGNGSINLNDAKLALRGALGIDKLESDEVMRGDIDGDNKVTLKDTQQILKGALGITQLGTGETDNNVGDSDNGTNNGTATQEPAGDAAQPSAPDNADKAEPIQTEKPTATTEPAQTQAPAQTEQPDGAQNPVHTHNWVPVYKTVHHDEVGHYETVVVEEAYDETTTEGVVICNQCGAEFTTTQYGSPDAAVEAFGNHVWDSWDNGNNCDNYRVEDRIIDIAHHDTVSEQKYVIDIAAYDEQVIDYYKCTCGAKK